MSKISDIAQEEVAMGTLVELTGAFQGIASMRIANIKNQVLQATKFFDELWGIYSQLRVGAAFHFGRSQGDAQISDKSLFIIITAEGGFSGDIDQKLIKFMLKEYDKEKHEIIAVGHHGAIQLAQQGITYKKYYKLPEKDANINVTPIIQEVQKYKSTTVFYQEYLSLMVQEVRRIELSAIVQEQGQDVEQSDDIISESTYIFEPSAYAVVDHLERSMMQISLSQLILNSKLAQYASRFRAMSTSNTRATDAKDDLRHMFNLERRAAKDERQKETINGLRKMRSRT